jgi:phage-related tail fiber protein
MPGTIDKLIIGNKASENEQTDNGYFQRNPTARGIAMSTSEIAPARPFRILHYLVGAAGGQTAGSSDDRTSS